MTTYDLSQGGLVFSPQKVLNRFLLHQLEIKIISRVRTYYIFASWCQNHIITKLDSKNYFSFSAPICPNRPQPFPPTQIFYNTFFVVLPLLQISSTLHQIQYIQPTGSHYKKLSLHFLATVLSNFCWQILFVSTHAIPAK